MCRAAGKGAWLGHWQLMGAAVVLTWLAALAKEIGITIVSCWPLDCSAVVRHLRSWDLLAGQRLCQP